ncbi:cyclin-like F-box containing protein [Cavenderia fasciculata]|uniref:Cyclin-like F-box containing protein n=1 Tax=Cavenderia fasciculata TaxID=261658 RepID=F4QCN5_CACFS|nr:cyclin-like F-box containing protein [Cavenderia fasciculata]EGG13617.1 cyclin-like F-box containing protein [Cavenderia fasciculata]|eukprot:XP_004350321.1 cyclin-like F-box containing protein [Cavenderia fasciculata]
MGQTLSKKKDPSSRRKQRIRTFFSSSNNNNNNNNNNYNVTVTEINQIDNLINGGDDGPSLVAATEIGQSSCHDHNGSGGCQSGSRKAVTITYKMFKNVDMVDSLCFEINNNNNPTINNNNDDQEEQQQQIEDYIYDNNDNVLLDHDNHHHHQMSFSGLSQEIQLLVLSFLGFRDIVSIQKTCKYWYNVGRDNTLWRELIAREIQWWANKESIQAILNTHHSSSSSSSSSHKQQQTNNIIRWKRVYCDLWRWRQCAGCGKQYRQCRNSKKSCNVHSDIRDIVHSRGVPSGVYWICCLSKPKDAAGCITKLHKELDEINYPNIIIQPSSPTASQSIK